VHCGTMEDLEIDHIQPILRTPGSPTNNQVSLKKLLANPDTYQLLCYRCHKKKTAEENKQRSQKDRSKCHGTLTQYLLYGCRCESCTEANRKHKRRTMERGVVDTEKCGTYNQYSNYGCRCDRCKEANRAYIKGYRDNHETKHSKLHNKSIELKNIIKSMTKHVA
jgi:hypothetical protein